MIFDDLSNSYISLVGFLSFLIFLITSKVFVQEKFDFLLDRDLSTMKSLSHEEMYKFLAEGTITKEGTVTEEDFITEAGFITKGERETTFNRDDYFNKYQQGSSRKMRKRSQSRKKKRKSRAKNMRKKSKRRRR